MFIYLGPRGPNKIEIKKEKISGNRVHFLSFSSHVIAVLSQNRQNYFSITLLSCSLFINLIYFFPIGNPWTFQYFVQHFLSKSLIWPTFTGGCRCDRETLYWIEQGGFKVVNSEKSFANLTAEIFSGYDADRFSLWTARIRISIVNSILVGFAEKENCTEEKKLL